MAKYRSLSEITDCDSYEVGQAVCQPAEIKIAFTDSLSQTPHSVVAAGKARAIDIPRRNSAATSVAPSPMFPAVAAPGGMSYAARDAFPERVSSKTPASLSSQSYGGLVTCDSPGLYLVAASEYNAEQQSSNGSQYPSPELGSSAMPSPLDLKRSVLDVKRGTPMLHSASTNSLGNSRVRSQVAESGFHAQSILAGLERMLAQSGRKRFELNDPLITYMRFLLKPHDPEAKATGRFAQMKAKLVPKRQTDISAPLNLRSAYQEGATGQYRTPIAIFDPTIEAVRKLFPGELTDVLKALVAIVISIRFLERLPIMDPDSPLAWADLQLSPELLQQQRNITSFENAPAKARAMLGMEKGMKKFTVQRSSSEVFGEPANGFEEPASDVLPKGRDRVETIQLGLKALAKYMIKESVVDMSDSGVQRMFDGVTELVRLSEGYE